MLVKIARTCCVNKQLKGLSDFNKVYILVPLYIHLVFPGCSAPHHPHWWIQANGLYFLEHHFSFWPAGREHGDFFMISLSRGWHLWCVGQIQPTVCFIRTQLYSFVCVLSMAAFAELNSCYSLYMAQKVSNTDCLDLYIKTVCNTVFKDSVQR